MRNERVRADRGAVGRQGRLSPLTLTALNGSVHGHLCIKDSRGSQNFLLPVLDKSAPPDTVLAGAWPDSESDDAECTFVPLLPVWGCVVARTLLEPDGDPVMLQRGLQLTVHTLGLVQHGERIHCPHTRHTYTLDCFSKSGLAGEGWGRVDAHSSVYVAQIEQPRRVFGLPAEPVRKLTSLLSLIAADKSRRSRKSLTKFVAPGWVIVEGPAGCGKSTLVRHVAATLKMTIVELDLVLVTSHENPRLVIEQNVSRALVCCPSVLIVRSASCPDTQAVLNQLLNTIKSFHQDAKDFSSDSAVVFTTENVRELPSSIQSACITTISLAQTSASAKNILETSLWAKSPDSPSQHEFQNDQNSLLDRVAATCTGLTNVQILSLVGAAWASAKETVEHSRRKSDDENDDCGGASGNGVSLELLAESFFENTSKRLPCRVHPNTLGRGSCGFEIPQVRWSDIGGLESVKLQLQECVVWPMTRAEAMARVGVTAPIAVLLYGPPGTGKTMLAKAVATESKFRFVSIDIPNIIRGAVGDSEKAIAAAFSYARQHSPCVVLVDEMQAIFGKRQGTADRCVTQLILELDRNAAQAADRPIVVIGTTNIPEAIDKALLRPGRFGRALYVAPPDREARRCILQRLTNRAGFVGEKDLEALVECSKGMTGADLMNACSMAVAMALERQGDEDKAPRYQDLQISLHTLRTEKLS